MTVLGGSPFYKGQKIAPLYMQNLVPRAIAIIEFGAEGGNCAVAKYKTTKMANKRSKFNFPCACLFGCCFSVLWVIGVVSTNRKTATPATSQSFAAI